MDITEKKGFICKGYHGKEWISWKGKDIMEKNYRENITGRKLYGKGNRGNEF